MNTESPWAIEHPTPADPAHVQQSFGDRYGKDALAAVAVAFCGVLLGLAVGALWLALAPPVQGVVSQGAAYFAAPESESEVAHDGWFAVIAVIVAVLMGVAVFLAFRRRATLGAMLGLAGGSIGGGYLAAWFGGAIGPGHGSIVEAARGVPDNTVFDLPSILRATGAIWLWPLVALAVFFLLYLLFGPVVDDEAAEPEGTGERPAWAGWGTEAPVVEGGRQAPDGADASAEATPDGAASDSDGGTPGVGPTPGRTDEQGEGPGGEGGQQKD